MDVRRAEGEALVVWAPSPWVRMRGPETPDWRTMTTMIRDVMTSVPVSVSPDRPIVDAARLMRDEGIGDVLVVENEHLVGVVTDRDLVVRCLAEGDLGQATVREACSSNVLTIGPDASIEDAVHVMRQHAVRRIPVVEGDRPIGIVSIGDLAIEQDPHSALADISAAPDDQ